MGPHNQPITHPQPITGPKPVDEYDVSAIISWSIKLCRKYCTAPIDGYDICWIIVNSNDDDVGTIGPRKIPEPNMSEGGAGVGGVSEGGAGGGGSEGGAGGGGEMKDNIGLMQLVQLTRYYIIHQ
ncbi:MAG TPA: hypothetical protein VEH06_14420 [Candidatus Bathyarchaeia archaeon]|nr:hypothetical protein [Candidatus Bathyarchaeia archaeon]